MRQRVEVTIARPPAAVFDFVAREHWRNHPRWDPDVLEIIPLDRRPIRAGSRALVRRKRAGGDELLEVLEFEPNARWVSRTQIGRFSLVMTALIEPARLDRSRLALVGDTQARPPLRYLLPALAPIFHRQMRASLDAIKQMVEAETPRA
jgi:hypothetical protein